MLCEMLLALGVLTGYIVQSPMALDMSAHDDKRPRNPRDVKDGIFQAVEVR